FRQRVDMMSEFDALSGLSTISNLIGQHHPNPNPNPVLVPLKKKRNLPGTPGKPNTLFLQCFPRQLPLSPPPPPQLPLWLDPPQNPNPFFSTAFSDHPPLFLPENQQSFFSEPLTTTSSYPPPPHMSATALLQKASQMGPSRTPPTPPILFNNTTAVTAYGMNNSAAPTAVLSDGRPMMKPIMGGAKEEIGGQNLTRDFLGVGNQVVHLTPAGSNQCSDQSRRH
ncbi:hypothetical protein SDJN02_18208, partial [Cucurbita argyrosperma subsp. argyrosperma]